MSGEQKLTLKALFESSVEKFKDQIALSFVDETPLTYGELGTCPTKSLKPYRNVESKRVTRSPS